MRTPRRNFVVEYKTNRRQTKAQPTSIWGNLNLQAVAREVDFEDVLLNSKTPPAEPLVENVAATETDALGSDLQVDAGIDRNSSVATPIMLGKIADMPASLEERPSGDTPSVSHETSVAAVLLAPKAGTSRVKKKPALKVAPALILAGEFRATEQPGLWEELLALEVENRRLKRLMITKLRAENDRIRSMLRRFGVA